MIIIIIITIIIVIINIVFFIRLYMYFLSRASFIIGLMAVKFASK
jgi:hypothetical protein